jgi:hypothetical protein
VLRRLHSVNPPPYHRPMRSGVASALLLALLLGACGNDPTSGPRVNLVAEPVGTDDVHLGDLPKAGVVVGSSDAVIFLDLDGTILATLQGYEVGGNLGAPGVWLRRGPKYFKLDFAHGLILRVGGIGRGT